MRHNSSWLWLVVAGGVFLAGCRTSPQTLAAATPVTTPTAPAVPTATTTPPPTPTWSPSAPPMPSPPAPPPANYPTAVQNIPRPVIETPTPAPTVVLPTPMPNPCRTPLPAGATWTTHTTRDGSLSFQYPANWAILGDNPPLGTPIATTKDIHVIIGNVPEECGRKELYGHLPEGPSFLWLQVRVFPHAVQEPHELDAFVAPREMGKVYYEWLTRTETTVAGQRAIRLDFKNRESPLPGAMVYFARGENVYAIVTSFMAPEFAPVFERLVTSAALNP